MQYVNIDIGLRDRTGLREEVMASNFDLMVLFVVMFMVILSI